MPADFRTSTARVAAALALGAAALTLTACSGMSNPVSARTSAPTSGSTTGTHSSSHPDPQASPTPTGGAGVLDATALDVPCTTLAPDATVTSAFPGMTSTTKSTAPAKSDAAVIGAYDGTVCSWTNTTGTTMTLAVGSFSDATLTKLKNSLATSSNPVPTYDGEGYFTLDGSTGTAEAFTGAYWIVATSDDPYFSEPGGAEPLVDSAIAALKKL